MRCNSQNYKRVNLSEIGSNIRLSLHMFLFADFFRTNISYTFRCTKSNALISDMILKFIFGACLFFSVCESLPTFKAENVSPIVNKVPSLINVTISGILKNNQGENASLPSSKTVANVSDCSPGSPNSSSDCTEAPPQAHIVSKNIDNEKEKNLLHEGPTAIVAVYTKAKIISFLRPPVNQTVMGEYHRLESIKSDAVGQPHGIDNGTSSNSTGYTKMAEVGSTKAYAVQRMARAKRESVQSALKKIFPDSFFLKEVNFDSDKSREKYGNRNSSRRQNIKKLDDGRFDGEAVYFRAEGETTTPAATEATTTAAAEDTTTAAAETTTSADAETTTSADAEATTTAAAEETTTAAAEATTTAATEETTPSSNSTTETGTNQENPTTSVGQLYNYHYHFHHFGIPGFPFPGEKSTTT